MRTAAARSSASASDARRRALRCRRTVTQLYVNNFMDRTVSMFDLSTLLDAGHRRTCRDSRPGCRHAADKLTRAGPAGQAALLRRAGHAPCARRLHQLRLLPQRRRLRRPDLGPHRFRRRTAQHGQPARPRRLARASCTGATTSTRCRTSRARSATSSGGSGLMANARLQRRHAQPAARRSEGRAQRGSRCTRGLRRHR